MKRTTAMMFLISFLVLSLPAWASTWCGENGLIRFSFGEGDSLVTVFDAGEGDGGVTRVKLHCWLTDIDPVKHDGEVFLNLGGFEMKLDIQGAEAFILSQEIPGKHLNVANETGHFIVGIPDGLGIKDGRVLLVSWDIMFQGRPENVRFGLDPAGVLSAATLEGAPDGDITALYMGSEASSQILFLFAAGYEPAWLNPAGEVDQEPVTGPQSWRDVGVFEAR